MMAPLINVVHQWCYRSDAIGVEKRWKERKWKKNDGCSLKRMFWLTSWSPGHCGLRPPHSGGNAPVAHRLGSRLLVTKCSVMYSAEERHTSPGSFCALSAASGRAHKITLWYDELWYGKTSRAKMHCDCHSETTANLTLVVMCITCVN